MKPVSITDHALIRAAKRGATRGEIELAVTSGDREPAKYGKTMARMNFRYNSLWQGKLYSVKQVAPVFAEEEDELVVVTVYVFYF